MRIRIGYEHPDSLLTYPHRRNLSACASQTRQAHPSQRRRGLDRKQKAQIAVAVITTLPQLIWAITFLLSTLMGS